MDLVRKIVDGAAERLTPEGMLIVEIGNEREYAEAAFGHLGLTWLTTSAWRRCMVFLLTAATRDPRKGSCEGSEPLCKVTWNDSRERFIPHDPSNA
jgi:hypothetical protein